MSSTLLIIDDEITFGQLLSVYFERKGYAVLLANEGLRGLRLAAERQPDLVILDVMMPGMDGWEVCRRLRELGDIPIIMLTAKGGQEDVIHGFTEGADDYVKKPFDLRELEMRIEAILRRRASWSVNGHLVYQDSTLRIDLAHRQVRRRDQAIHLTPTEFRLLSYLVQQRHRVVPHKELIIEVWGPSYVGDTRSLSLYIRYLREKLEDDPANPRYIRTEWGVGYRFAPVIDPSSTP